MKRPRIVVVVLLVIGFGLLWSVWRWQAAAPIVESRALADIQAPSSGEEGYGVAFAAELKKIGEISPQEFSRRYAGKGTFLTKFSWDPTTAKFWDEFNKNPNVQGQQVRLRGAEDKLRREWAKKSGKPLPEDKAIMIPTWGMYDFRLNADELAKFKQNGFVVSERMGAPSCTEMFYRIYKRDLPVFVSSDAILHAWHRSYDAILEEVETSMLIPTLDEILAGMSKKIPEAMSQYGNGDWQQSLKDADYFLAVARSLLAGQAMPSVLGQNQKVADTVEACDRLQMQKFTLFGKERTVDFSQFKPRGHYEKSQQLRRYFRAMMWCGRIDMRVAGDPGQASPRQLAAAIALHDLLHRAGKFDRWQQFDRIIQTFVGDSDSMTFAQLDALLNAADVHTPAAIKGQAGLVALQKRISSSKLGAQEIRGHVFEVNPSDPNTYILPRTFCFLGQKFVIDSWVTSKIVYDDVIWKGEKVMRRIPSCLDVSFAVFGNDHVTPFLVERINNPQGRRFRDGLNYQQSLAAARQVIDKKPAILWQKNLYTGWLGCLRQLSQPTTDKKYPEAMRTRAWAMKTTNTQLASWTQLRHDTILYVKQSYTGAPSCYYPAGFVEPVPHFWKQMEQTVQRAAKLVENTPYPQPTFQKKHAKFLRNFAAKLTTLRGIAEKELAQKPLNKAETKFLEDIIEVHHVRIGSGGRREFAGWYPGLFYFGGVDSMKWDALVADVHTDPPAPPWGDPGCVLHQGVGSVDLLMIAVDNGKDRMVFAGPTLSHYEFEMPNATRKTDSEWKADLRAGRIPPRPVWTRSYLVPGKNEGQRNYYGN